jgi:hypothetical protein
MGIDSCTLAGHSCHTVTSSSYTWRHLRFTAPPGWRDDTLVTFTAPDASMNVTVSSEPLAGDLSTWARAQEAALAAQRPKGYRPISLDKTTIGTHVAVVADRELGEPSRGPLFQRQAFVALGGDVVIVTATASRADRERAIDAVALVVSSLSIGARE